MKKGRALLVGGILGGFSAMSPAENLLQVYQQAKIANPDLRSSAALRDQALEKINQARSPLLPQLGLDADYSYSNGLRDLNGVSSQVTGGTLKLTQTLFDMAKWHALTVQEKKAGIQDVTYQMEQQNLMLNTATKYFDVLNALDALSYTKAQKQALYHQLDRITQRFNVGLEAITDVQNARAKYDGVLAEEVAARNRLDNAQEALRHITGQSYRQLAELNIDNFTPQQPDSVAALVKNAESRNLLLLKTRLQQDLAREQIRCAATGHMPTLDLTAISEVSNHHYSGSRAGTNNGIGQNKMVLSFSLPLYNGGSVSSQVKQAQLGFVSASEQLESTRRSVVQTTRTAFNNISAAISSINAYKQAVVSAQSSLDAMEAGYQVGRRTIVDVLNATSTVYDNQQRLSNSRYNYLIYIINLKLAQGTLNENDMRALNATLGAEVSTSATATDSPSPELKMPHHERLQRKAVKFHGDSP